jgi:hypothetical protein
VFNIICCPTCKEERKKGEQQVLPLKPFIEAGGQEDKYAEGYGGSPILGEWVFAVIVEQ